MVIRTRIRGIVTPLLFWCVSGGIAGYFVWHAINGERGLKTKDEYERQITVLRDQLADLKRDHAVWAHKIDLMSGSTVDRDLLDEQARFTLGRAGKNDLVVLLPAQLRP
jgi:cell division protein FtsB